jgi:hypothetical protein
VGFWGIWNNNYGGAGDTVNYINQLTGSTDFGQQETDPSKLCLGDALKLDRHGTFGHSVIFLGYEGPPDNRQICYWSSNSGTNGYGKQCEPMKKMKRFSILKVNKPEVIANIKEPFNGKNDTALYQSAYTKSTPNADSQMVAFKNAGSVAAPVEAPGPAPGPGPGPGPGPAAAPTGGAPADPNIPH